MSSDSNTERSTPVANATPDKSFTLVFEGDLRKFPSNPLHTDTPFGRAYAAGIGNAFEIMDLLADGSDSDQEKSVAPAPSEQETRSELLKANLLNSVLVGQMKEIDRWSLVILSAVNFADKDHLVDVGSALKGAREALSQADKAKA